MAETMGTFEELQAMVAQNPELKAQLLKRVQGQSAIQTPAGAGALQRPQLGGVLGGLQRSVDMIPSVLLEGKAPSLSDMYGRQALKGTDPSFYEKELFKASLKEPKTEKPLKVGEKLLDPKTFEVVYEGEEKPMSFQEQKAKYDLERKQEEEKNVKTAKGENVMRSASETLNTIAEVEKGKKYFGVLGGLPSLPWDYDRKRWEAETNKLLAKNILNLMSDLKSASKTGATGFGQLSEKELKVLQDGATALNRGLSPEDAQQILDGMKPALQKVLSGGAGNEMSTTNNSLPDFSQMSDEELRKLAGE